MLVVFRVLKQQKERYACKMDAVDGVGGDNEDGCTRLAENTGSNPNLPAITGIAAIGGAQWGLARRSRMAFGED